MSGKAPTPPEAEPFASATADARTDGPPLPWAPPWDVTAPRPQPEPIEIAGPEVARRIRKYLAARRERDELLGPGWFQDPAWDILLDLLASLHENKAVTVTSACIAAAVPSTTALRWLKALVDHGAAIRRIDPSDGRRVYVDIEPQIALRVERWVALNLPASGR